MVELSGALSNPLTRSKAPLSAVFELHAELLVRPPTASSGGSGRALKARPTRVKEVVEQIVSEAAGPLRVRDVISTLADRTDICVDPASIRKTLHDGTRGPAPRFRRVGWGLYTTPTRGGADSA